MHCIVEVSNGKSHARAGRAGLAGAPVVGFAPCGIALVPRRKNARRDGEFISFNEIINKIKNKRAVHALVATGGGRCDVARVGHRTVDRSFERYNRFNSESE